MQAIDEQTFQENLNHLEGNGFLLIENALDEETVVRWRETLYGLYDKEAYEIDNSVGNVAFEKLLALQPELSQGLIAHPSVGSYLKAVMGKQCQLRSFRAHLNPREYLQEWHMDFYDYWYQEEKAEARRPVIGLCMNTTFYLTDNRPEQGRLTFVKDFFNRAVPEEMRKHMGYTDDRTNRFQVWCDEQPHVDLYPMAGDAVIFYSHIPHQGAKTGPDAPGLIRANIVLHFQQNPMFPGIKFVSNPQFTLDQLGYAGTFPFAK
ncbi:MAG: phytanoyl-CoA dioxygenase family protein [bacterium]|nr:phytanoyl-CoA dioxygenase family protein [bacterium]